MDELITDLLTLSRVGRKDTELGKVNLNEIVESIENDIIAILKEKNAVILKDDLPVIEGQATWLKQLFLNLITNGLKFNESPQPTIRIRVEQSEEIYQFIVNDNGIGISSEYFEKIFDLFERLHSNDQYEGTGAGLSICKRIVEGFGGRIWVESEAGVGSSFYFTIPKTNG
ncbi:hypothetical protein HOJ44_03835 [Candidatus Bathyarchaeota archaeon]|nr:hypothetical protein [Candidatus Bathyarchaeota archaeon]